MIGMAAPVIDIAGVGVTFERDGARIVAFKDVSLKADAGRFVVLIGPSGCGKSTLLRAIADLLTCTDGRLRIFGEEPSAARQARESRRCK